MYLYTVNAFPYGPFKNQIVKEQVYEPDWRSEERTQYTMNVAEILADVVPARHFAVDPERAARLQAECHRQGRDRQLHRARHAGRRTPDRPREAHRPHRHAWRSSPSRSASSRPPTRRSTTSPTTSTPANPPRCWRSFPACRSRKRSSRSASFIGMVFDICHQAVVYEDIAVSLQKLVDAGIPIFKLQEAAALRIPNVTQKNVDTLRRYAKTIYLTQTVEKKDGKLNRFLNLEDAFKAWESESRPARMAHAFPRAGVPRRSRRIRHHALRHRGCAEIPQEEAAVARSSRSRPTPGTCCRIISRPATSSITSRARSNGCKGQLSITQRQ